MNLKKIVGEIGIEIGIETGHMVEKSVVVDVAEIPSQEMKGSVVKKVRGQTILWIDIVRKARGGKTETESEAVVMGVMKEDEDEMSHPSLKGVVGNVIMMMVTLITNQVEINQTRRVEDQKMRIDVSHEMKMKRCRQRMETMRENDEKIARGHHPVRERGRDTGQGHLDMKEIINPFLVIVMRKEGRGVREEVVAIGKGVEAGVIVPMQGKMEMMNIMIMKRMNIVIRRRMN